LDVESVEDLKRKLREMGYSERAVEEILKWYRQNNS
jgi:SOS response regulatory protein OraA/RecX